MSIRQSDTKFPQGVNQRRDWTVHTVEMKQENFDVFKNCTGEVISTDEELSLCQYLEQPFSHRRLLPATTSGVSYVISPTPAYTSLTTGFRFVIQADAPNSANPTVTVNSLAPVNLVFNDGIAVDVDTISTNSVFEIIYMDDVFRLLKL